MLPGDAAGPSNAANGLMRSEHSGAEARCALHNVRGGGSSSVPGSSSQQYDFGGHFALPNVRTSLPSPLAPSQHGRQRGGALGPPDSGGMPMLPITPHGADLDPMSFIIPDGPEHLGNMHLNDLHLFSKSDPMSPLMMPASWGVFEPCISRPPTTQELTSIQKWLAKAKELQQRAQRLWEQEEAELQRGAEMKIINPVSSNSMALLDGSPAPPVPSSAMAMAHMHNTLSSPNSMAFWRTMQGLSPTCFAEVRLLDSTPTKSALVDL